MAFEITDGPLICRGYQQFTATTATSLTVPSQSKYALIEVEAAARWRDDGTSPTASVGMPLASGESMWYAGDLDAFEIIGGEVNVSYYAG